jgi:hypothetical protein
MKRVVTMLILMVTAASVLGLAVPAMADEDELELPVAAVPQHVIDAALAAAPGLVIAEAEVEAVLVYELEGTVGGQVVEVEVTSEGDVIGVESEDDGGDDSDGDDDDD